MHGEGIPTTLEVKVIKLTLKHQQLRLTYKRANNMITVTLRKEIPRPYVAFICFDL